MAETKRDWGFWGFWLSVASIFVAAGLGLRMRPLVYAGLGIVAVCILAVFVIRPFAVVLSDISRWTLHCLGWIVRAIAGAYVTIGAFLLRPFVKRILRIEGGSGWTAGSNRFGEDSSHGYYDYKVLAGNGHRVADARLTVFPDYRCKSWVVGLALSPTPLGFDPNPRKGIVFCALESHNNSTPQLVCHRDDATPWRSGTDPRIPQKASFVFGLTVFPEKTPGRLALRIDVDSSAASQFDIPSEYARNLILFALAEESLSNFRVDFTQIHLSWVPE